MSNPEDGNADDAFPDPERGPRSVLATNCRLAGEDEGGYSHNMTGVEVIEEIKRLPRKERTKVIEFARQLSESQPLTPEELGELAKRMVECNDAAEADRLQDMIIRGFYGDGSHA